MATVLELLTDAMQLAGIIDPGEPITTASQANALREFNRMLDVWSTESLMKYTVNRSVYTPFVPGQQDYTLGPGGNINTARPVVIQSCSILLPSGVPEIPIRILTDAEWQNTPIKNVPSTFPTSVWIQGNTPLNTLSFYPVPTVATVGLVLYTWGLIGPYSTVNDTPTLPRGWEEAIVSNLAVILTSSYKLPLDNAILARASYSKRRIEILNAEPMRVKSDLTIIGSRQPYSPNSFGYMVD